MAINSDVGVCNLGLSMLGNYGTLSNIQTPTNDKELTFSIWYDICRQFTLKLMMPNFALDRLVVAKLVETPAFGYEFYYEYPNSCLKLLGIGNVADKQNNYAVEGNKIATDLDEDEGLEIRIIRDIEDVNQFSPEYKLLLAQYLAAYTCLAITQDTSKAAKLMADLPQQISTASGLNAQENVPIRISNSRFKASRFNSNPDFTEKK